MYGYARSRKVVWAGFGALAFASFMSAVVVALPPSPQWHGQEHLEAVFGSTWRTALASLLGYACGEFANSVTLAKLKVRTYGQFLWVRTIGSTIVGEAADTLVFYPLAFLGVWSHSLLVTVMMGNYVIKVLWEVLATPVTYRVVAFLKRQGERGLLRPRHRLHAVLAEDLKSGSPFPAATVVVPNPQSEPRSEQSESTKACAMKTRMIGALSLVGIGFSPSGAWACATLYKPRSSPKDDSKCEPPHRPGSGP